ncbi:Protein turtle-like A [Acipenser ruthenus]|uniref:Protein turtle-like A n=1 Tax=Acipenser ruthenus TaxID=7906 RepID=A0A444UVQ3_ACIRT|nr:Protein turtle-like A [Acipenser ruthenus]
MERYEACSACFYEREEGGTEGEGLREGEGAMEHENTDKHSDDSTIISPNPEKEDLTPASVLKQSPGFESGPTWDQNPAGLFKDKPSLESTGELTTSIPQEPGYLENEAASQKRDGIFLEQTSSDLQSQNRFTCETSQWPSHFQGHPGTFQIRPSGFEASNTGQPTSQGPETESSLVRPPEAKRLPFRTYLPRGYSWPSPYHSSLELRESEGEAQSETERQREREAEIEMKDVRDVKEARASFASQSSGRGSVGPTFAPSLHRYSLSLTPSLPASPETTQNEAESETRAEEKARSVPPHLGSRAKKRRDTSVDESYEWDSVDFPVESEILEALKLYSRESETAGERKRERPRSTIAVRELESRGLLSPDPPVSPASSQYRLPVRSLSEARFNELRQEFLEYRREQESSRDKKPDSEATLL